MDFTEPPVVLSFEARNAAYETTGAWATEAEAAAELDARLNRMDVFRIYPEVRGELLQPRRGQVDKTVRIDRVLVPTDRLLDLGWRHGAIGIEAKRSGIRVGPPIAQAMDYVRSVWTLRGVHIMLGAVFVWPMAKQGGPVASLMVHNRVGSASDAYNTTIQLRLGEENILRVDWEGQLDLGSINSGRKVGSR